MVQDEAYLSNIDWGKPRQGHPEGTIRAHIQDLEANLERLKPFISEEQFWKLRVLIHVHDAFKGVAAQNVAIVHPQSHASLAREFLAGYTADADLLNMVQFHDEPFAVWRQFRHQEKLNHPRLNALIETIEDWDLFLMFQLVDGLTTGKEANHLVWFIDLVRSRLTTTVDSSLIEMIRPTQ